MSLIKAKSLEVECFESLTTEVTQENRTCKTLYERIVVYFTNITVEPILILYMLPSVMVYITTQNINLEKACRVDLNLSQHVCDGLTARNSSMHSENDEIKVQKLVASWYVWKNIIQSAIPTILLMFVGSWSDKHNRRKPSIIMPICGEAVSCICLLIGTYYFYELSLAYSILAQAVPHAVTGGPLVLATGLYSYVSAISTSNTRTSRIGAVSICTTASSMVGIAISGLVLVQIGFYGVYSLSLGMYAICIIYGSIMLKEVDNGKSDYKRNIDFFKDFFDWKHLLETFQVAFKDREGSRRNRIWCIMVLVMVVVGPAHGEMTVLYLFLRYRYQWNELNYSAYLTFTTIIQLIGTILSISFFSKYLKMDDALLGIIATSCKIISAFVFAFAPNSTIVYLAAVIDIFGGISFIAMRSILSKLVPANELGKINSLFGVSEALMPVLYGPMYSMVYRATIQIFPSTFLILGAILMFPAIPTFIWLFFEHKQDIRDQKQNKPLKEVLLKEEKSINIRSNSL